MNYLVPLQITLHSCTIGTLLKVERFDIWVESCFVPSDCILTPCRVTAFWTCKRSAIWVYWKVFLQTIISSARIGTFITFERQFSWMMLYFMILQTTFELWPVVTIWTSKGFFLRYPSGRGRESGQFEQMTFLLLIISIIRTGLSTTTPHCMVKKSPISAISMAEMLWIMRDPKAVNAWCSWSCLTSLQLIVEEVFIIIILQ